MSKILRRFVCGEYLGSAEQKETRPYYATACLLMCDSEFRGQVGGGRSLGELQRQGSETNHVGMLLKLLNAAMDIGAPGTAGPGTVVDVYFVRVPGSCAAAAEDRGLVAVIIGVGSLATMQTWTLGLRKILSARGHGAKAVGGCDASHFGRLLNACMHPRIFTRAGLPTGDNYMYDDLTSYVDDIAAQHVQAEQQQQQGGGGGDGVALVVTREALQGVEAVEPRKLLNPFLALNARRVCVSETVLDVWPSASFLCSDLEGSVFRDDGRLDFGALPEACRVYRMALGDMSMDAFFPDQLPKTEQLAQLLQGMYPSLGSVLAGKTRAEICESVLEGRATGLTAEEGGPVTFPHPLRGHPSLTEEVTSGTLSMGYLSEIEGRIARARGRGVAAEELRRLMVRSFALATNLMMTDKDDTPYGPQCVAREMLAGLRKHGLHFVRPRDRPCGGSGAWVGWVLQQLDRLGMLTHDVSIGLRMLMATLTTHMCDDGGVQLFLTGAASDGKTFAVGELLRRVVVSLQPMSSVSKRALDSAQLGVLLRNNVAFFDDVKPGMLEGIETEMKLLMGRKTKAGRATNMDFNKPQEGQGKGSVAGSGAAVKMMPSPSSVVMTSNFLLRDVVAGSEKGIVGGSAFESRMFNYKLKPVRLEGRDVTLLSEARAGEEQEHEDSSALRYFYSCCSFVALCMSAKIVPMPVMSGHGELVRALSGEFRKLCAAFLSDDQRVMMHMNNLPIAAAIMEQVYERVVMGGGGEQNQRAELTDLCEIFYDIAESLLPTVEHVVFGASMVMDSANGLRDQASVVAGQLLAVVRAEWYIPDHRGFVMDESSQQEFLRVHQQENSKVDFKTLMGLLADIKYTTDGDDQGRPVTRQAVRKLSNTNQPVAGPSSSSSASTQRRGGGGGGMSGFVYVVDPQLLFDAVGADSVVDSVIGEALGFGEEDDVVGEEGDGSREVVFLEFYHTLKTMLGMRSDVPIGDAGVNDVLMMRMYIGAVEASLHAEDRGVEWFRAPMRGHGGGGGGGNGLFPNVFQLAAEHDEESALYRSALKYKLRFTRAYMQKLGEASKTNTRVERAVGHAVTEPGVYALCVPATRNVRMVETVVVTEDMAAAAVARRGARKTVFQDVSAVRGGAALREACPGLTRRLVVSPASPLNSYELGMFTRLAGMFNEGVEREGVANSVFVGRVRALVRKHYIGRVREANDAQARAVNFDLPRLVDFMDRSHRSDDADSTADAMLMYLHSKLDVVKRAAEASAEAAAAAAASDAIVPSHSQPMGGAGEASSAASSVGDEEEEDGLMMEGLFGTKPMAGAGQGQTANGEQRGVKRVRDDDDDDDDYSD